MERDIRQTRKRTMSTFFLIIRTIRAAYKGLRALVGLMLVTHGAVRWAKNKRASCNPAQ